MSQIGRPASQAKDDNVHDIDKRLFNASVRKAMEVLEAFNGGTPEQTIGQLTAATGADRSSVQRAVYTLQKMGYLSSDPGTRRYRVSEKMMDMSFAFLRADRMVEAALSPLALLSERTGESVHLSRMSGSDIVYLLRWPTGMQQHFASLPGRRLPLFCTSGGRAMLSLWPRDAMIDLIRNCPMESRTAKTITDPDRVIELIDLARDLGYARSDGECLIGESAISSPVQFPGDQHSGAALHVTLPDSKYTDAELEAKIIPHLKNAAQMLSQIMSS
ncbi:MAG: IclR family transcriptional regulator C-terminal domain-containing protein [Roseovarius sp.]|nr:IclR family transcriptional regulator C-terminal domain-containing protein [Roseovarius sp.]